MKASISRSAALLCALALATGQAWADIRDDAAASQGMAVEVVYPSWFKDSLLDLRADLDEARAAGKTGILLFFGTRSCSYCHALLETSFARPDIQARLRQHFDVIGLEVLSDLEITDTDGHSHWARDFAVKEKAQFTPTLVFYDTDGRVLLRLVGYQPTERFEAVLDYLQEHRYARQGLRDYLQERQTAAATQVRGLQRDDVLFARPPHVLDRRSAADRPLLVLFERPDCPSCERLHRTLLREHSIRQLLSYFEVVQLDMEDMGTRLVIPDGGTSTPGAWAASLGLLHTPALVFFDEEGREVLRNDSELLIDAHGRGLEQADQATIGNLEARLWYVLEKGYVQHPQFQRWRRHKMLQTAAQDVEYD